MFPVLFEIGSVSLYSYGFFIALGYLAAIATTIYLARRDNLDPGKLVDLAFYLLVIGFIGCRILFVITRWDHFVHDPIRMFYIWEGGLVFFGGLITGTAYLIWYLRRHNLPTLRVLDIGACAITIGHALGRVGCLAAGCCHGALCDAPWAIHLHSEHVQENLRGLPIHPTQIYAAVSLTLLYLLLMYIWKHRKFPGQVALTYLAIYPIIRSVIEVYRGDSIRGYVIEGLLTTSQFISILIFIGAGIFYYRLRLKSQNEKGA